MSSLFDKPLPFIEIGLYIVEDLEQNEIEVNINMVDVKCIPTKINNEKMILPFYINCNKIVKKIL